VGCTKGGGGGGEGANCGIFVLGGGGGVFDHGDGPLIWPRGAGGGAWECICFFLTGGGQKPRPSTLPPHRKTRGARHVPGGTGATFPQFALVKRKKKLNPRLFNHKTSRLVCHHQDFSVRFGPRLPPCRLGGGTWKRARPPEPKGWWMGHLVSQETNNWEMRGKTRPGGGTKTHKGGGGGRGWGGGGTNLFGLYFGL